MTEVQQGKRKAREMEHSFEREEPEFKVKKTATVRRRSSFIRGKYDTFFFISQ